MGVQKEDTTNINRRDIGKWSILRDNRMVDLWVFKYLLEISALRSKS